MGTEASVLPPLFLLPLSSELAMMVILTEKLLCIGFAHRTGQVPPSSGQDGAGGRLGPVRQPDAQAGAVPRVGRGPWGVESQLPLGAEFRVAEGKARVELVSAPPSRSRGALWGWDASQETGAPGGGCPCVGPSGRFAKPAPRAALSLSRDGKWSSVEVPCSHRWPRGGAARLSCARGERGRQAEEGWRLGLGLTGCRSPLCSFSTKSPQPGMWSHRGRTWLYALAAAGRPGGRSSALSQGLGAFPAASCPGLRLWPEL
uniref:Uncharacterized protein n=1 Tax=Myotis myotis TaxID=51298 RepID=A0A7J7S1Y7_MYOMY|nr:hypothetical protein mMyoMyo1_010108 [Myotis myotis]